MLKVYQFHYSLSIFSEFIFVQNIKILFNKIILHFLLNYIKVYYHQLINDYEKQKNIISPREYKKRGSGK